MGSEMKVMGASISKKTIGNTSERLEVKKGRSRLQKHFYLQISGRMGL